MVTSSKDPTEGSAESWSYSERMAHEHKALGMWLTGHPLRRYDSMKLMIPLRGNVTIANLAKQRSSVIIRTAGVVSKIHKIKTKAGQDMVFVTLSDSDAIVEFCCFQDVYARCGKRIAMGRALFMSGSLDKDGVDGRFIVTDIQEADTLWRIKPTLVELFIDRPDLERLLPQVVRLIERYQLPSGRTVNLSVYVCYDGLKVGCGAEVCLDLVPEFYLEAENIFGKLGHVDVSCLK